MSEEQFSKAERAVLRRLAALDRNFGGSTMGYVHRLAGGAGKEAVASLVTEGLVVQSKPRRGRSGSYRLAPSKQRAIPADFARQFRAFVVSNFAAGAYRLPSNASES